MADADPWLAIDRDPVLNESALEVDAMYPGTPRIGYGLTKPEIEECHRSVDAAFTEFLASKPERDRQRAARAAELAALRRDAAISLLIEAPAECSDRAPMPGRCGTCWTCRVDKFLRDAGVRR